MSHTPLKPSREEFRELAKQGNLIPVYTELIADCESPVAAFQKIDDGGYSFLLESAEKNDQVGRYSFVGS
ncbi:MAG: anthranilate synthase component I, partial [Chthoniobacteraceae bacterium]